MFFFSFMNICVSNHQNIVNLFWFVVHGGKRLLNCLLANLTVVPAQSGGVNNCNSTFVESLRKGHLTYLCHEYWKAFCLSAQSSKHVLCWSSFACVLCPERDSAQLLSSWSTTSQIDIIATMQMFSYPGLVGHPRPEVSSSPLFFKNGLILPTGQWYAPSAVINDAWNCMVLHCIA